ncbi:MAG: helix-turn-helix transcriptional regulator [Parvibaculum sp.]|uniref:helix-turn-helix domain-containing protein n=1 Tax=Parvibaculum sp. TaxID=2024848 RepID=UPI00271B0ECD|nr:helix-turn-helix transcriptional regulator [Parvibaculum sp.]MDO8838782.1 helix-turn-helix transcriptional regulator [Parvibaculum sp.]
MAHWKTRELVAQLREAARQANISASELATRAGIARETLSRMGRTADVRVETLEELGRVVGLTLAFVPADDEVRALRQGTLIDLDGSRNEGDA